MKWTVMLVKQKMITINADSYGAAVGKSIGIALDKTIMDQDDGQWVVESVTLCPEMESPP